MGTGATLGLNPGCSILVNLGQSLLFSEPQCYNLWNGIYPLTYSLIQHVFIKCLSCARHYASKNLIVEMNGNRQFQCSWSLTNVAERGGLS